MFSTRQATVLVECGARIKAATTRQSDWVGPRPTGEEQQ